MNLLEFSEKLGCRMFLKMHFLHSHLEFFLKILEQLVMSKVKDYIKISKQWKKGIREFGMRV